MKTSELSGAALDWAVAKCEGYLEPLFKEQRPRVVLYEWADGKRPAWNPTDFGNYGAEGFCPSTDWAQGGPIIEREGIGIQFVPAGTSHGWWAIKGEPFHDRSRPDETRGDTPLIAAMRCYVASKLGDEIEIPEELK